MHVDIYYFHVLLIQSLQLIQQELLNISCRQPQVQSYILNYHSFRGGQAFLVFSLVLSSYSKSGFVDSVLSYIKDLL